MTRKEQQLAVAIVGLVVLLAEAKIADATKLPEVRLTAAAARKATAMLSAEDDKRAILTLVKGNFEVFDKSGNVKERRSGWMVRVVNRAQFANQQKIFIDDLKLLIPQEHLYHELEGAVLDYSGTWWILRTED